MLWEGLEGIRWHLGGIREAFVGIREAFGGIWEVCGGTWEAGELPRGPQIQGPCQVGGRSARPAGQ